MVEVKARATREQAAGAVSPHQRQRLQCAAADFLAHHPRYANADVRFDAMLVSPRRWPLHLRDAWRPDFE